jgi:hypothetical protein
MIAGRKSTGNMLSLVVLTMGAILALVLIGLVFNTFLFQCSRAQYKVDALAINLAGKINSGDRVGQMNDLVEASRELIFVCDENMQQCQSQELEVLTPLCNQLLEEARRGQALVEDERKQQIQMIVTELTDEATKYNRAAGAIDALAMLGLKANEPLITKIDVGYVRQMDSNVHDLRMLPELSKADAEKGNTAQRSKLFRANHNAKLPGLQHDLAFKFSPLSACTRGVYAPARNANLQIFVPTGTILKNGTGQPCTLDYAPSAVSITCTMDAAMENQQAATTVGLTAVGITPGAVSGDE